MPASPSGARNSARHPDPLDIYHRGVANDVVGAGLARDLPQAGMTKEALLSTGRAIMACLIESKAFFVSFAMMKRSRAGALLHGAQVIDLRREEREVVYPPGCLPCNRHDVSRVFRQ